jgi:hypothetical protein
MSVELASIRRTLRRAVPVLALSVGVLLVPAAAAPAAETCPNQAVREQQKASYLPGCRAYELASPINKNEQEVEGPTQFAKELAFKAAANRSSVVFTLTGAIPSSLSGGLYSQALSSSAAPGSEWLAHPQNPENGLGTLPSLGPKDSGEFYYYSPDLECGIEATTLPLARHNGEPTPLLAPGETGDEKIGKLYRWDAVGEAFTLVTSIKPSNPTAAGQEPYNYFVDGASAECAHVIYENGQPGYALEGDPVGSLYEWSEATGPRVASVLPSNNKATTVSGSSGGTKGSNIGQISTDGSRIFFTAGSDGEGPGESAEAGADEVYARINGSSTVSISKSHTAVPDNGARFQAATADGGVVLFTANYGLAESSTPSKAPGEVCERTSGAGEGTGHCDLYRYDLNSGTLTDLSVDATDASGATVRGVLGMSSDASAVYFSATGQLVPGMGNTQAANQATTGTTPYGLPKETTEANVYEYRDGVLSYVATIGTPEAGVGGSDQQVDAVAGTAGTKNLVARVSSDGNFLLLGTQKQLNGYDNRQQGSETREWEQYEYSEASSSLICISCKPSGERPIVNPATQEHAPFEAHGVFVNHPLSLPNSLNDDGRVFFDSFDPLVAQATNKDVNAYEWDPVGVGGCEQAAGCVGILDSGTDSFPSYFEDASLNGNDVYVTTVGQLAPQDTDGLRDIYDVRVDGGILFTPPPPGCSGEECQGPLGGGLAGSAHASETAHGGNPPLTNAPPTAGVTPPEAGVKGFIRRKLSRSHRVMVSVVAPGAGRISVTGNGLKMRKLAVSKGGKYVLSVPLTVKEIKALKRKHRLKLRIHVSFVSTAGHASSITAAVTVR